MPGGVLARRPAGCVGDRTYRSSDVIDSGALAAQYGRQFLHGGCHALIRGQLRLPQTCVLKRAVPQQLDMLICQTGLAGQPG